MDAFRAFRDSERREATARYHLKSMRTGRANSSSGTDKAARQRTMLEQWQRANENFASALPRSYKE